MGLPAAADPHQHLHAALFEIHLQRHEREPLLQGPIRKLADLTAVHEQLPRPLRHMVELVGLVVFGNVAAEQPDLAAIDAAVGLVERHPPAAEALHLAADQRDAALERVEDLVVVAGLAIFRHHLLGRFVVGLALGLCLALAGRLGGFSGRLGWLGCGHG